MSASAYFTGDNKNDNVEAGNYARELRKFVSLPGGPTVLVTCHPVKNAEQSNLIPRRGGGAFLNEVDGNLACVHTRGTRLVEVTTHGKFRGPEFAPFSFKLVSATSDRLKDSKGRPVWTAFAAPVTDAEQAEMEKADYGNRNHLLYVMKSDPGLSMAKLAEKLCWRNSKGELKAGAADAEAAAR